MTQPRDPKWCSKFDCPHGYCCVTHCPEPGCGGGYSETNFCWWCRDRPGKNSKGDGPCQICKGTGKKYA